MKKEIIIYQPYCLNEIGGRGNNEDSIFPVKGDVNLNSRMFLVCDGVGGSNKGEVASRILCESIPSYFKSNNLIPDCNNIKDAVRYAEGQLTAHINSFPDCSGMASTMTFLSLNSNGAIIAWVGDSRVYHIRNGKILFKTKDHSLVNYLVDIGEIKPEEAENHPKKNHILRAVQSADAPVKVDSILLEDIQEGDFFLLCTDGLLEQNTDKIITELFNGKNKNDDIFKQLLKNSEGKTKDNFSMYFLRIHSVFITESSSTPLPKKENKRKTYVLYLLIILFITSIITFFLIKGIKMNNLRFKIPLNKEKTHKNKVSFEQIKFNTNGKYSCFA